MGNGWFVFAVVASIVVCAGFVVASAVMRAAWAQREREALTSDDLRALEESAVMLIDRLKTEADAAVTEIDKRRKALSKLIKDADEKLLQLADLQARIATPPATPSAVEGPSTPSRHPEPVEGLSSPSATPSAVEGRPAATLSAVEGQSVSDTQASDVLRILELSDAGMDPAEIAKATGIECAEVNLILNLSRKFAA